MWLISYHRDISIGFSKLHRLVFDGGWSEGSSSSFKGVRSGGKAKQSIEKGNTQNTNGYKGGWGLCALKEKAKPRSMHVQDMRPS